MSTCSRCGAVIGPRCRRYVASRWIWVASGRYSGRSATARSRSTSADAAPGSWSSSEPGTRSVNTRTACTAHTANPARSTKEPSSSAVNRRAGRDALPDRRECLVGVHDLEQSVAEDQVGAVGPDHLDEPGDVALVAGNVDADLPRPSGECSQGVRARVDDGDAVSGERDPHGEATGAAADVDDVAGRARQHRFEPIPDNGGAP